MIHENFHFHLDVLHDENLFDYVGIDLEHLH